MDYLAITFIGAGGSWTRGQNKEGVIHSLVRQVRRDWGSTYQLGDIKIGIYDVTGHDHVQFSVDRGVWDADTNETLQRVDFHTWPKGMSLPRGNRKERAEKSRRA